MDDLPTEIAGLKKKSDSYLKKVNLGLATTVSLVLTAISITWQVAEFKSAHQAVQPSPAPISATATGNVTSVNVNVGDESATRQTSRPAPFPNPPTGEKLRGAPKVRPDSANTVGQAQPGIGKSGPLNRTRLVHSHPPASPATEDALIDSISTASAARQVVPPKSAIPVSDIGPTDSQKVCPGSNDRNTCVELGKAYLSSSKPGDRATACNYLRDADDFSSNPLFEKYCVNNQGNGNHA